MTGPPNNGLQRKALRAAAEAEDVGRRRLRAIRVLVILSVSLLTAGCAAYMHGYTVDRYAQRTLSPDSKDGAYRLELESKVDVTISNYIADHGTPDYLRVVDMNKVFFYYLSEDLVTEFVRPWYDINSRVTPHRPIPEEQKSHLPIAAAAQLDRSGATPFDQIDACFSKCLELTDRSKEECFDTCRAPAAQQGVEPVR